MNVEHLTDSQLAAALTEARQQTEAIRPYYSRDLEQRRRLLWQEYERREERRKTLPPAPTTLTVGPL